ncbi:hypothetical protein [Nocardia flavorosea]|uniref:Uncharacterized protein n=1 Tax=Nocardia flavorosea TaxID=53429 RepID=A0A846YHP8_9NOCA|nr:hypothetical protein [Nocardia flavorosea]NKY57142.1 hypothetical protein [Nocardia flavorosea]
MLIEDYQRSVPACPGVLLRPHPAGIGTVLRGNAEAVLPELTSSDDCFVRRELEKYMVMGLFRHERDCRIYANHQAAKDISVMNPAGYAIIHTIDPHFEHR